MLPDDAEPPPGGNYLSTAKIFAAMQQFKASGVTESRDPHGRLASLGSRRILVDVQNIILYTRFITCLCTVMWRGPVVAPKRRQSRPSLRAKPGEPVTSPDKLIHQRRGPLGPLRHSGDHRCKPNLQPHRHSSFFAAYANCHDRVWTR